MVEDAARALAPRLMPAACAIDARPRASHAQQAWFVAWARTRDALERTNGPRDETRADRAVETGCAARDNVRECVIFDGAHGGPAWCASIAAPRVHREPASQAQGRAALLVALDGHLLLDGNAHEGADAARVVCSLYRRAGVDGFVRLGGNFAFVLADPTQGLWLVRDALGGRPLFRAYADGVRLAGGSAIEVARAAGGGLRCDGRALDRYLATGHAPLRDDTLLVGVRVQPPGHAAGWLATGEERVAVQRCVPRDDAATLSAERAAEEWWERTVAICAAQSASGRTGLALSGGLDSCGLLAALHATHGAPVPCFTFSHDRDDLPAHWNERESAEAAAGACGGDMHVVTMHAGELPPMLDKVARWQDFPSGSPVVLAQARLSEAAAAHGVTNLLTGHGPDTLLGGGDSQLVARAAECLARGSFGAAWRLLRGARAYSHQSFARLVGATLTNMRPGRAAARSVRARIDAQLYRDVVPVSLQIETCNARAVGIDQRSPYLVRELVEFALGLGPELIVAPDGSTKALLRRALRGRVPASIVERRRGIGFAVPVLPWLLESECWLRERLDMVAALRRPEAPDAESSIRTLRRRDGRAWREAFRAWRWISLAAWVQAHGVSMPGGVRP